MSQLIALTGKYGRGRYTIVDDEDYFYLKFFKWHLTEDGYAERSPVGVRKMHRLIIGAVKGQLVDHRNGDKLDNRRHNLRVSDVFENATNRTRMKNNQSGFPGVYLDERRGKWRADIMARGQKTYLGTFETAEMAASVYREASLRLHGQYSPFASRSKESRLVMETVII